MRKITAQAVRAFRNGQTFHCSNTSVLIESHDYGQKIMVVLYLHLNPIARYPMGEFEELEVSNGGWSSNTTKERLNGLPGVRVCQRDWVWYLNGAEWGGEWRRVRQTEEHAA